MSLEHKNLAYESYVPSYDDVRVVKPDVLDTKHVIYWLKTEKNLKKLMFFFLFSQKS